MNDENDFKLWPVYSRGLTHEKVEENT